MDATQIAEESVLRDHLQSELELLMAYQSKICMHTDGLHQRERKELDDLTMTRRSQLIQRVCKIRSSAYNIGIATLTSLTHRKLFDHHTVKDIPCV